MICPFDADTVTELVLNQVQVDYLKLTSWSQELEDVFGVLLQTVQYPTGKAKLQHYFGAKYPNGFVGRGRQVHSEEQGTLPHYMGIVSGSLADELLPSFWRIIPNARCRRIDLQMTVKDKLDFNDLYLELRKSSVNCKLVRSNGSTLYVGSRSSRRFIRIYEKDTSANLVRFEVEYKSELAEEMYIRETPLAQLFLAEVLRIDKYCGVMCHLKPFLDALDGVLPTTITVSRKDKPDGLSPFYKNVVRRYLWGLFCSLEIRELIIDDLLNLMDQSELNPSSDYVSPGVGNFPTPDLKDDLSEIYSGLVKKPEVNGNMYDSEYDAEVNNHRPDGKRKKATISKKQMLPY